MAVYQLTLEEAEKTHPLNPWRYMRADSDKYDNPKPHADSFTATAKSL